MAVEQRSSRDETDFVSRFIFGQILGYGQVSHVFLNKVWQQFALWAADFLLINYAAKLYDVNVNVNE
jgi:hypothetical protein